MTNARRAIAATLASIFLLCAPAKANYVARDGNNNLITFWSFVLGGGQVLQTQTPVDALGAALGVSANPFYVVCSSGCSGSGGGGNVNITQVLGAAPSASNPLWVSPAAGATFQISAATLPLPNGAATQTTLASILSTMGSPMQQTGGVVGISGTLPAFASPPTVNQGTSPWVVSGAVTISGSPTVVATGAAASGAAASGNPVLQGHVFRSTQPTVTNGQAVEAQATARGALIVATGVDAFNVAYASPPAVSVNNFPATQAVTQSTSPWVVSNGGTFAVQAAQSGTWNVNNVSGTISLPTGASTAAKQPAIGTAGTPSADVLSVQGVASGTPVPVSGTVTANAGTNLNTSLLALETGGNLATLATDAGAPGSTACATDTGSCNANAQRQRIAQRLTSVLAAVGTPMQNSGGSVAISGSVAVTGAFFQATQPVSAASLPLPALAATSTKQSDGSQKTQIVDGSGNVIASTSNNLNVQCANCSGSGASAVDAASYTYASSVFAPAGGFFQTTATTNPLANGQQGMWQMTATRAGFVNLRNAAGAEAGTSGAPIRTDPTGSTTQPVSAASLPLPAGAATSANQTSEITQLTAIAAAQGTTADSPCALPASSTACTENALLKAMANAINSSIPAGSAIIGKVGIDQTTPGTTNGVQVVAALPAGAALLGKTGIDQTTPGTTNAITYPDVRPSSGTVTVQDTGSTSVATGQNGSTIVTGTPTASSFQTTTTLGLSMFRFQVSGTWTGTLQAEQSVDGGTTWGLAGCHVNGTSFSGSTLTGNGIFDCEAAGATNVRVRATAAVTGTATVQFTSTPHPGVVKTLNATAPTSTASNIVPNNTSGVSVKGSPGAVYHVEVYGISAATPAYLKLYDTASAPTCGSGTPKRRILIPALSTGTGAVTSMDLGVGFTAGIGYCVTTGITDADTTAPAANTYLVTIDYK